MSVIDWILNHRGLIEGVSGIFSAATIGLLAWNAVVAARRLDAIEERLGD